MKAITTGAVILSLAAITGCAMHGSDDRYSHRDRSAHAQDSSAHNTMGGDQRHNMDSRRDGNWNSSDKTNRDWQNRDRSKAHWQ